MSKLGTLAEKAFKGFSYFVGATTLLGGVAIKAVDTLELRAQGQGQREGSGEYMQRECANPQRTFSRVTLCAAAAANNWQNALNGVTNGAKAALKSTSHHP